MQSWFFVEEPNNATLRCAGDVSEGTEADEVVSEEFVPMDWVFRVRAPNLRPEEVVCLTGDISELGNWIPDKCVVLEKVEDDIWSINLKVPSKRKIHYRYFIGVVVKLNKHVIVRCWETNFHPRRIKSGEIQDPKEEDNFGSYNGYTKVDRGWLATGMIVQFVLNKKPFNLWRPQYKQREVYIKITPILLGTNASGRRQSQDESQSGDQHDYPEYNFTEVASLHSKDSQFKPQEQFGHAFNEGDMNMYHCYVLDRANTAFLVDVYVYSSQAIDDEPPYHAGFCVILPTVFKGSTGNLVLPLISMKQRPLGELKLEYLLILPLPTFNSDMRITYSRYWKKTKQGLNVGHRGSGSSFKLEVNESSEIRENTIASLKRAVLHGADYVEFDVQLSKDLVPVIYHDYHVCIAMKKKKTFTDSDMLELPIKELTLDQLRILKLYNLMEGKTKNLRFYDEELEEHQPFPTLKSALELVDRKCGFNIEIKWTNKYADGTYELNDAIDINCYVDTILEVVLKNAEDRAIVFSSFNPDICTLIRLKQNKYPVMFLTQGQTTKYPQYDDPRCWTITSAVQFANMIEILGLCPHTEDILRDPTLVQHGLNAGMVMFCWGDVTDAFTIQYLKDLGLHGIIYDKIYQYIGNSEKESIYLMDGRESQQELLRSVAKAQGEPAVVLPESQSQYATGTEKLLHERMDAECDKISTATSLASLETNQSIIIKIIDFC
ncbi:glycerophosphoryl diester phosphodiesterase [Holotrichia oblita]|uniref:Glycerophosphoryl diester phosphodiesterase n=2 Tax=Holotrichia oblita TaxID=644536 RepID=A0ACB9TBL5_HOLOL|nr:glycerophosphoryl diester phosphodiesterase [Holotrichia oblita]KAI4464174.1 glycerophosphoryl diester phosphodiesterase [Holotrichia oblita]